MAYPLIQIQTGSWRSAGPYPNYLAWYYTRFHIGTGPLWFVEALLIFAFCYATWRAFVRTAASPIESDVKLPGNLTIALFAAALGAVSFLVRIWLPVGWAFGPLNLQFPFFPQYVCMFIVGIAAYRRNWLTRIPDSMGRIWLLIAAVMIVIIFPALFVLGGAAKGNITPFIGGLHWQCFGYALWEQVTGTAIIIALLFLFHKHLNHQGNLAQAASASAYAAYIIHGPIIILVALAVRGITLQPLLKFVLAVLISVPLCFGLSNVIRRLPLAKKIL
jgi:hypothetical protein